MVEWKDDILYTIGSTNTTVITTEPVNYIGTQVAYGDENGVGISPAYHDPSPKIKRSE